MADAAEAADEATAPDPVGPTPLTARQMSRRCVMVVR